MNSLRLVFILSVSLCFCSGTFAQQSPAPTVTFNVPVQFTDLNQGVTQIKIICNLLDGSRRQVGVGDQVISPIPADGSINTTVTVVASQYSNFDITTAVSYTALFQIYAGNDVLQPARNADRIEARAKEGTPFTYIVNGPFSW